MLRTRRGVTLIELLTVVVIITIAAASAIPRLSEKKDEAYIAAMKSALRDIATREASYALHHRGRYFSGNGATQGFIPSQHMNVTATATMNPNSWSATARQSLTPKTCEMVATGVITCT